MIVILSAISALLIVVAYILWSINKECKELEAMKDDTKNKYD